MLLTTEQTVERLRAAGIKVTPMTVRRWFKSGRLVGAQVSDRSPIKIEEKSVDALIKASRTPKESRQ